MILGLEHVKNRSSSKLQWWLDKGYSKEEAKEKLKDRQITFSKEKLIKKYGEDGLKKWTERQQKWIETLNTKSDEEKSRINKAKAFGGINAMRNMNIASPFISKPEKELYTVLLSNGFDLNSQLCLNHSSALHYFYDVNVGNKIIEFNGDYWHANPNKYTAESNFNFSKQLTTVQQIWDNDKKKINIAESQGYKVLTIWESDWKNNKQKCIDECIKFLQE
jgi:G:T-mismatch repair DNA endonuclease (very short patch repair protein)